MLQAQEPRLLRQTSLAVGMADHYGESARKSEDEAVVAGEKVNGRGCYG